MDTIALLGHVGADLSGLRREQMKPALKQEFHTLCFKELEPGPSKLLFGEELAKQIRDVKETTRIGNTVGTGQNMTVNTIRKAAVRRGITKAITATNQTAENVSLFCGRAPDKTSKPRQNIAEAQQNTKVNIHPHFDYNSLRGRCDSFQAEI